ncbi:MAG: YdcF family protein [Gammaproteobacteria bacterium]|nr:YdcF family protein [Gammaproteobacteria bacterium]
MDQVLVIKIISALLYPLGLVVLLATLGWIFGIFRWKKIGRSLTLVSILILLLSSNPNVAKWLVKSLEQQYPQRDLGSTEKHDAIVVLGGGLRIPLPPALYTQIGSGSDRLWHAVRLYRAGKADEIILAGGNIFELLDFQGEAYYASELLQQWGIPKSAIFIEANSRTTRQNARNTARYLAERDIRKILLVTSAYHMPRAIAAFGQLSLVITPASADILIRNYSLPEVLQWVPSAPALAQTTLAVHEYYGMWFADLNALIGSDW